MKLPVLVAAVLFVGSTANAESCQSVIRECGTETYTYQPAPERERLVERIGKALEVYSNAHAVYNDCAERRRRCTPEKIKLIEYPSVAVGVTLTPKTETSTEVSLRTYKLLKSIKVGPDTASISFPFNGASDKTGGYLQLNTRLVHSTPGTCILDLTSYRDNARNWGKEFELRTGLSIKTNFLSASVNENGAGYSVATDLSEQVDQNVKVDYKAADFDRLGELVQSRRTKDALNVRIVCGGIPTKSQKIKGKYFGDFFQETIDTDVDGMHISEVLRSLQRQ